MKKPKNIPLTGNNYLLFFCYYPSKLKLFSENIVKGLWRKFPLKLF